MKRGIRSSEVQRFPAFNVSPISKTFFLTSFLISGIAAFTLLGIDVFFDYSLTHNTFLTLLIIGLALLIYDAIVFIVLLYNAWNAIQFGNPRSTPGKAVGFLFIPFFNLYWIFPAIWGFSVDYNRIINNIAYSGARYEIDHSRGSIFGIRGFYLLPEGLFLSLPIFILITFFFQMIWAAISLATSNPPVINFAVILNALLEPVDIVFALLLVQFILASVIVSKTCNAINALTCIVAVEVIEKPFEETMPVHRKKSPFGVLIAEQGPLKGQTFKLSTGRTYVIGRAGDIKLPADDLTASREHARIRDENGKFVIYDMGSTNRVYVNGEKTTRKVLINGDKIKLGKTIFRFQWVRGK